MADRSTQPYLFGDLLGLARRSWIAQVSARLAARGYDDYRRSDAAVMRILSRQPMTLGTLGTALGITRQAARKLADSLTARGLAATSRHKEDARSVLVSLTACGRQYAAAITEVIAELNNEFAGRVDAAELAVADRVLREVLAIGQEPTASPRRRRPAAR